MPRHKATPSKRLLVSTPGSSAPKKRPKRLPASQRPRTEPLRLSSVATAGGWGEDDALGLEFPVDCPTLAPSLSVLCSGVGPSAAPQLHIDLTLVENGQVTLQVRGREDAAQLSLAELFPDTNEAWRPHIVTLAERGLLNLHINAKREAEDVKWSFSLAVGVAWRKYMESCSSRGLAPMSAAPRATPMRAMHHVMIWLLKKTHEATSRVAEADATCRFRYWQEIEVLYDRFVGVNSAVCVLFESQTFAMPEIYARIDATKQLSRDVSDYETVEATLADLLPTLRGYQKAAVSWMLSREKPSVQYGHSLPLCVTFSEAAARNLQAYDPFCAAFYTNPSSAGTLETQQEQLRPIGIDLSSVSGGILADEMGLGKTVEVIALVLSHRSSSLRPRLLSTHSPRPDSGPEDNDAVACICGSSETHPMGLVQCKFCGTWHHQLCTGYGAKESGRESKLDSTTSSHGLWDFGTSGHATNEATSSWSCAEFMCYHCQSHERPAFSSRTTLIVSPEPIHSQWEHEFSRHVCAGALSVMRYPGVHTVRTRLEGVGPSAEWQLLASPGLVLARYDVVLTTYEALGADLRHVPTTEGTDRRSSTRSQRKRYAFVGSPLVALRFWRVCMDEAQVGVENTRLQAALTLSRLSAVNRWVVTGTPFSSRVSELFGYLRFLRIPPYTISQEEGNRPGQNHQLLQSEHNEREGLDAGFFREAVEHNFARGAVDRVLDLLLWNGQGDIDTVCGGGILWRTGKKHVLDQLGLPPQKNEVVWCRFAAVERHFYDQQEKRILSLIQQRQRQEQKSIQASEVIERDDRLWQDLLVLRQLCCHPQVGGARQVWGSSGNTSGTVMTMDAFLQELLNKATRECEEAQRQLIGAQNGLAALLVLDHDMSGAALKYMAEMSLIRTNWPHFRADLLPRLHILQNLEKCVQQLYSLHETDFQAESESLSSGGNRATADPKKVCLLPELPVLKRRISSTGLLPDSNDLCEEDRTAIIRECAMVGKSARQVRQCYLLQADMKHAQALTNFRKVFQMIDEGQHNSSGSTTELLCTSGNWWNDALSIVEKSEQSNDPQLVDRVRARLSGFDTRWGTTFCSQLVSTRSLRLLLVRELEVLAKRRRDLFDRLAALSDGTPTDADVEISGNCKKCRDGGTGPICTHCQLYKELDAYRRHLLGVDKTSTTKTRIVDLFEDNEMEDEDTVVAAKDSSGGLSASLFVEIFKEISGCARSALRSQKDGRELATEMQTALQTETEFWVKLQREWQAAKKLFQTQHQRLGSLDELVMACSQLRLRQPDEPAARTKAERLYKLERVEVPVRAADLESDRAAADLDLRDKMAQLRYLLQLQSEAGTRQAEQAHQHETSSEISSSQPVRPLCAVCLQEFTQRRAVLPCAHVFCMSCTSNLTGGHQHTRKSVRCPTCRRVCPVDSVTVVVEGLTSESTSTIAEGLSQSESVAEVPSQLAPPHRNSRSLGSKLDTLLARVDMLRQENPGVKCLLFSQWSQMLELAVQALPRLGVRCFMYGTKRQLPKLIAQFQTCPAACVLALPFKVGANGLNIVEATEVLLIEPLLSSSIEAQAVNRVHRLGQTRRTRVHRFIVRGSVEERIFRLGHKLKTNDVGVEQASNEEADDDEGLQRLGVAPGRKEQEKLTMEDLEELLRGNSDNAVASGLQSNATTVFWKELVILNGNCISRAAAYEFLERRHATQTRGKNQDGRLDYRGPQTKLFDKLMGLLVAEELLGLPYPADLNSVGVLERVDCELLQRHQEQIKEQIRVWRNLQADNAA
ncbi:hypothetical protein PHYPSEUDO_007694 [Phytophthora pseudosyringae]|uniref:RING-type domain-containing protein n=1 Tax=Phytophthora pseudosyringae TaxID=221518 RepID=A0A8T1VIY5_9STRA|nr:hypothetical protein PHYPSEUDO_007694 [Phytophthora pseudosyringae]